MQHRPLGLMERIAIRPKAIGGIALVSGFASLALSVSLYAGGSIFGGTIAFAGGLGGIVSFFHFRKPILVIAGSRITVKLRGANMIIPVKKIEAFTWNDIDVLHIHVESMNTPVKVKLSGASAGRKNLLRTTLPRLGKTCEGSMFKGVIVQKTTHGDFLDEA